MADGADGIATIFLLVIGLIAFYFFRPIAFFFLALGAFMLPSAFKYFCFFPLILFLVRYIRLRDRKSLFVFAMAVIPAMSIGGHSAWQETSWGKQQLAEQAAHPKPLTPAQQSGLACAREIREYLKSAKAKAQAADQALDKDWPSSQIDRACRLTLQFQAEKSKKYMHLTDAEIATWNGRIKSAETSVRAYAATATQMESDIRSIVAKHFPEQDLTAEVILFSAVIDPFTNIPRRLEEQINQKFADYPKWPGDSQFSDLAFVAGENEAIRKAKGLKFCDKFTSHSGMGSLLPGAINRGLIYVDAEIARLAPPKPAKKFHIDQPAQGK
jgi:hypothetical protein